jgi:hypothetical protein
MFGFDGCLDISKMFQYVDPGLAIDSASLKLLCELIFLVNHVVYSRAQLETIGDSSETPHFRSSPTLTSDD